MTDRIVLLVHPDMARSLEKVVWMFEAGLRELGFEPVVVSQPPSGEPQRAVVFGANFYTLSELASLKRNSIILNVENVESHLITDGYKRILKDFHVWDYNAHNAEVLSQIIRRPVRVFKFFYAERLSRIVEAPDQDIDVLFYGSSNPRRDAVLDALRGRGLNVHVVRDVYGADLDALIARAKVVINIHYYENGCFEIVRVFDLLANRCAVVSEVNPGEPVDDDLVGNIASAPYERLVDVTEGLVGDSDLRKMVAAAGFIAFKNRSVQCLHEMITSSEVQVVPAVANIGSGKRYDSAALNIDIDGGWRPDIVADIGDRALFDRLNASLRFGEFRLQRGWFDSIALTDVLQQLPDLVAAMTNLLELLTDGGILSIGVPYDLSHGAWQDPTHVRAFNERSWLYYCDWHWYLGWTESRFDVVSQQFVYSEVGHALARHGVGEDEILRTPRAVDAIQVALRKRRLTEAERAHGEAMRGADGAVVPIQGIAS